MDLMLGRRKPMGNYDDIMFPLLHIMASRATYYDPQKWFSCHIGEVSHGYRFQFRADVKGGYFVAFVFRKRTPRRQS